MTPPRKTLLNSEFRTPLLAREPEVSHHTLRPNSILICLTSPVSRMSASLSIGAEFTFDDLQAFKKLISQFSEKVGDGLSQIQAKLVGPKISLDRIELLFKRHGIAIAARKETTLIEPSQAFLYAGSGRLKLGPVF